MKKYHRIPEVELVSATGRLSETKEMIKATKLFNIALHRMFGQPVIHKFKHKNRRSTYKIWVYV